MAFNHRNEAALSQQKKPQVEPRTGLSTLDDWRQVTLAEPMSPEVENLMPSLVTPMTTVSPMLASSPIMRLNSPAGMRTLRRGRPIVTVTLYYGVCFHTGASQYARV